MVRAFCVLFAVACVGEVEPGDDPGRADSPDLPETPARPAPRESGGAGPPSSPAAAPPPAGAPGSALGDGEAPVIRRLTRVEYSNTLRDLLGDSEDRGSAFPPEESVKHFAFDNNAAALTFPPTFAEQAFAAAEAVARRVVACAGAETEACARTFLETLGKRAWRRPLAAEEITRLMAVFRMGATEEGFRRGVEMAATTLLVSVPFLYRVEVGDRGRLTSWEIAARLSYFLWGSMPDAALFDAAEKDQLGTKEAVRAQAERMLADPKARNTVARFHRQWLQLAAVAQIDKDRRRFPSFRPELRELFRQETEGFLADVAWGPTGSFADLFTGRFTFANADLARFYGLPGGSGATFRKIDVDGVRRLGFLTQGSFLATRAGYDQTSPVQRGKFVREQLLCADLPPPPPSVANTPSPPSPTATTRERTNAHSRDPACAGCHALIDPIGFGLEAYDAVGLHRATESGKPIDDSGDVPGADVGPFKGVAGLAAKLAASAEARACFARQWFRFALGRREGAADGAALQHLAAALRAGEGRYRSLLVAITQTDSFLSPGGAR